MMPFQNMGIIVMTFKVVIVLSYVIGNLRVVDFVVAVVVVVAVVGCRCFKKMRGILIIGE